MQLFKRAWFLFAFAIAISTMLVVYQPGKTQTSSFFCGTEVYNGRRVPTTFANSRRGGRPIPIIYWVSEYFSSVDSTPQTRCETVSEKFQAYYDNGLLRYIGTEVINDLQVICVATSEEAKCTESDIIVTLPPEVDRFEALETLTYVARFVNVAPLELTDELIVHREGEAYINFEVFLDRALSAQ